MRVPILDNHFRLDPSKGRNIEESVNQSRSHSRRRSFPTVSFPGEPCVNSNAWLSSNQSTIALGQTLFSFLSQDGAFYGVTGCITAVDDGPHRNELIRIEAHRQRDLEGGSRRE